VRDANTPVDRYDWMVRVFARLEVALSWTADLVICNSRLGIAEAQARHFPANRLALIFNGIDTERFSPNPVIRARMRAQLGLADEDIAIGSVARIDVKKDFETLFASVALLRARRPKLRLFIVGTGDAIYEDRLRALTSKLGIAELTVWLGSRPDVPALYNAFDVVCLPSLSEGFPNVVAEAMASGLACAVSDVGDSAFIVSDRGLVSKVGNIEELARAIDYGLKTRHLAGERRDRILHTFNIAALVERTEAALRNAL
jgi:glycosyltransferase involved in cell wall biosynthesis